MGATGSHYLRGTRHGSDGERLKIGVSKVVPGTKGLAIVNVLRPRTEDVRGWNEGFC